MSRDDRPLGPGSGIRDPLAELVRALCEVEEEMKSLVRGCRDSMPPGAFPLRLGFSRRGSPSALYWKLRAGSSGDPAGQAGTGKGWARSGALRRLRIRTRGDLERALYRHGLGAQRSWILGVQDRAGALNQAHRILVRGLGGLLWALRGPSGTASDPPGGPELAPAGVARDSILGHPALGDLVDLGGGLEDPGSFEEGRGSRSGPEADGGLRISSRILEIERRVDRALDRAPPVP